MTCTQHHTDLIKNKMEENVATNNEFKNSINKKVTDERIQILHGKLKILKKENHCLKNEIKSQ